MDFGSISGRSSKSSMKRKSLLGAFRKSSQPPPTSYVPPALPSSTSSHYPHHQGQGQGHDEPESPYPESISSHGHAQAHGLSEFGGGGAGGSSFREGSMRSHAQGSTYTYDAPPSAASHSTFVRPGGGRDRAPSGKFSAASSGRTEKMDEKEREKEREKGAVVRRPDDLVRVVKDRMFSWSYMMTWYQGSVKIPRSAMEAYLGPKQLDARARNYYVLGMSLGQLLDVAGAVEFLRALIRLLDEWDGLAEGGASKVKSLFRGQKTARKSSGSGEYHSLVHGDPDSMLYPAHLPFALDFFQVHSTLCSIIRDVYKRILRLFLPSKPPSSMWSAPAPDPDALEHQATVIHSAPLDEPFTHPLPTSSTAASANSVHGPPTANSVHSASTGTTGQSGSTATAIPGAAPGTGSGSGAGFNANPLRSPSTRSTSSASHSLSHSHAYSSQAPSRSQSQTQSHSHSRSHSQSHSQFRGAGGNGNGQQINGGVLGQGVDLGELGLARGAVGAGTGHDAFQAYILGELPPGRTLVGEGYAMGREVVELFARADAKLRKHLSVLLRETDTLARRVLDSELADLSASLVPGSRALQFDFSAAMSSTGNGYRYATADGLQSGGVPPAGGSGTLRSRTSSMGRFAPSLSVHGHGHVGAGGGATSMRDAHGAGSEVIRDLRDEGQGYGVGMGMGGQYPGHQVGGGLYASGQGPGPGPGLVSGSGYGHGHERRGSADSRWSARSGAAGGDARVG